MAAYQSWGNYPRATHQQVEMLRWRPKTLHLRSEQQSVLPYGLGRSQGDVCLNDQGWLLDSSALNHFMAFDKERGVIRCEAGVTLADILAITIPRGWILPVIPGTKFVTVAGAVANDVHGKNHVQAGSFGCHVTELELLRSDGQAYVCSSTENQALFAATVGGLGLTGLITWVEIRLKPIVSPYVTVRVTPFSSLSHFFELAEHREATEYVIGQIDTILGRHFGRGVLMTADHETTPATYLRRASRAIGVPFTAPSFFLNDAGMKLFNELYYWKTVRRLRQRVYYEPYFFPLDGVLNWNRLYGRRGFLQYQCVVPMTDAPAVFAKLMTKLKQHKISAYLTSLKIFGDRRSPGLLSFPRPGYVIALDIPYRGNKLLKLLEECDELVREAGGAVYPAKDARMSAESFQTYFPRWQEFSQHVDPAFSSSFWRRVTTP